MNKIRALIVDDEVKALMTMRLLIQKYCPEIAIIGEVENIDDALRLIIEKAPDVVFLDINMPNGSGLDLLQRIKDVDVEIVFTTAYQEYAIRALRLSALDYLLKPVDPEELIESIKRFTEKKRDRRDLSLIHEILHEKTPKRMAIHAVEGVRVIQIADIHYLSADRNYTTFHMENEEIIASKSIGEFERLIEGFGFFRIHRSFLLNMSHLAEYKKGKESKVRLTNGVELEVARNRKDLLLEEIKRIK